MSQRMISSLLKPSKANSTRRSLLSKMCIRDRSADKDEPMEEDKPVDEGKLTEDA